MKTSLGGETSLVRVIAVIGLSSLGALCVRACASVQREIGR